MDLTIGLRHHGVQSPQRQPRYLDPNRFTVRLLPTLVVSIGILVLISVGSVLIVNWAADRHIVREFISRLVARDLAAEERSLREYLDAAVDQGDFIAAAIGSGRFRFGEPALADFLSGTLAAAPQVAGLIVSDPHGKALHLLRGATATEFTIENFDVAADAQFAAFADQIRTHKHPYWGAPIYRVPWQETFLNYFVPIWNGETYMGFAALGITTRALSALAKDLSEPPRSVAFLLYGRDRVLAHPLMTEGSPRQSESASFPLLRNFGDPVIENIDNLPPTRDIGLAAPEGVLAREPSVGDERYYVFAREITDYRELPITVGSYFLKRAVDGPIRLFYWATIIALALLALALIVAAIMAEAISRPIRRAAKGATTIGNLDFDEVEPLAGSFFREINSLARSFNAMLDALRAFGRYVPRTLVRDWSRRAGSAPGPKNVCSPSCSPTSSASHPHAKQCRPPRSPASSISTFRSSPPASNRRAAQSTSSSATPSWPFGERRAGLKIPPRQPAGLPSPSKARSRPTTNTASVRDCGRYESASVSIWARSSWATSVLRAESTTRSSETW